MKETNVVLYDLSSIFNTNAAPELLSPDKTEITHCIVYEYMQVFHSFLNDILAKSLGHSSQCIMVLERVAIVYGVYATYKPLAELRRRSPHIYSALLAHVEDVVRAVREYMIQNVKSEFSVNVKTYKYELTNIRTKTWGDKHFLMYTRYLESLKWPSVLSK